MENRFALFTPAELQGLACALFAAAGEGALDDAAERLAHEMADEMRTRDMRDIVGPFMHHWPDADHWLAAIEVTN